MFDVYPFWRGPASSGWIEMLDGLDGAHYQSVLGYYYVDSDGTIGYADLITTNTRDASGDRIKVFDERTGGGLGPTYFFLVSDGADWAEIIGDGTLSFIDRKDGTVANVADGADVTLALNGVPVDEFAFHSYDASLNFDGLEHVVSGVLKETERPKTVIAFEDMPFGGDMDYQDVVFTFFSQFEGGF